MHTITATITTRYRNEARPRAVDADITIDGVDVASVSLYRDAGTGFLSVDETTPTEFWCSGAYAAILDQMDSHEREVTIEAIEQAVRAAA